MQFATHESVSLEKQIDLKTTPVRSNLENLESTYEIGRCVQWIQSNQFKKVCLQFPDYLLPDSSEIVLKLQTLLGQTLYILGDTAYGSCCIDYVAAAHINADAIIHFGAKCFSQTASKIPCLRIHEQKAIDLEKFHSSFVEFREQLKEPVEILLDDSFIYCKEKFEGLDANLYTLEDKLEVLRDRTVLFIGDDKRKLLNLYLTFRPNVLYYFDACGSGIQQYEQNEMILKRRYFLIEKIRDSRTIGIVIGTVSVANYLEIIDRLKKLIENSGKKYYLISVGKPTVAKLANIGDIDVYAVVTCAMNEIYESRDFYKPIVTPFDVEMALNESSSTPNDFTYDYNAFLSKATEVKGGNVEEKLDVSLLSGNIRNLSRKNEECGESDEKTNDIALRSDGTLALNSSYGAGFLANRSWKGLEQNLGRNDAKVAEEGRSGIASNYENEFANC